MTDVTEDDAAAAGMRAQMAMGAMFDLAAPQERYLELIANGGFIEPMPGMALSFARANTEYVLRHGTGASPSTASSRDTKSSSAHPACGTSRI